MAVVRLSPAALAPLCERLKALSDDNRMSIFLFLRDGERCVCDIVDALGLPQPLVSHHLAALRSSEILRSRRSGKWVYYSINKETMAQMRESFLDLFDPNEISTEPTPECGPAGRCDV